ncbi:MAG: hypothetical protein WC405_03070 [Syntrophales bacterium]
MRELPDFVETTGWTWKHFSTPSLPSYDFWLGIDRTGNRWLTKLTGDFYAYREIVFARLAQAMGWSCQSSVFMRLDPSSAEMLGRTPHEIHAAHWFLDEHKDLPCSTNCGLAPLIGKSIGRVEDLEDVPVAHILDWPKSEYAACLFGGNEPPGRLFTKLHEFVIIDSELMFSSVPCSFESTIWLTGDDQERPSVRGQELAIEVCKDLVSLGSETIRQSLSIPTGVTVSERWPIGPILFESHAYAERYARRSIGT